MIKLFSQAAVRKLATREHFDPVLRIYQAAREMYEGRSPFQVSELTPHRRGFLGNGDLTASFWVAYSEIVNPHCRPENARLYAETRKAYLPNRLGCVVSVEFSASTGLCSLRSSIDTYTGSGASIDHVHRGVPAARVLQRVPYLFDNVKFPGPEALV